MRVRVAADHATSTTGRFSLPPQGAWGIVEFYQDSPNTGLWTHTLPDRRQHAAPLELLTDDPRAIVDYLPGGAQLIHFSDGDLELACADGTLFRLTASDRDPKGVTPRHRSVRDDSSSRREAYTPERHAPLHLHLAKATSAGAFHIDVTREGELSLDLTASDQAMYRLHGDPNGTLTLTNHAAASAQLGADGSVQLSTRTGARITISATGSIDVQAAPGMPLSIQGTGAPVAHVGSLVGPGPLGLMVLTGNPLLQTAPT